MKEPLAMMFTLKSVKILSLLHLAQMGVIVREDTTDEWASELRKTVAKSFLAEQREFALDTAEFLGIEIDLDSTGSDLWKLDCYWGTSFPYREKWRLDKDSGYSAIQIQNLLLSPPSRLILAILDGKPLSVFQTLAVIGYSRDRFAGAIDMMSEAMGIFIHVLSRGDISPRHPDTLIRFADGPKCDIQGNAYIPDLSWELSFDDANAWAQKTFLADLGKLLEELASDHGNSPEGRSEEAPVLLGRTSRSGETKMRQSCLVVIAALCEKAGIAPGKRGLSTELASLSERLGVPKDDGTIRNILKEAAALTE